MRGDTKAKTHVHFAYRAGRYKKNEIVLAAGCAFWVNTSLNPATEGGKKGLELEMSDNDTNDFENAVGAAVTRVPPIITAIIAVGGLVAAYFMTIGEFKVKDMELQQKVLYLEQKVDHIEETMDDIKSKLEARIPVVDGDRQDLRKEIDSLKQVIQEMKPLLKR